MRRGIRMGKNEWGYNTEREGGGNLRKTWGGMSEVRMLREKEEDFEKEEKG